MNNLDQLYGPLLVLTAGATGALVRVVFSPPPTRVLKLAHMVCGTLMSVFVAPGIVEHWFKGEGLAVQCGIAVCVGALGPNLAEVAIRLVQRRGDDVANRFVDRAIGEEEQK